MKNNFFKCNKKSIIGRYVTAYPGEGKPWVKYESSDDGEKNYYRDVFSKEDNTLIYCYGETCMIEGFDNDGRIVTLSNDNIDDSGKVVFDISFEQFFADFI